MNDEVKPKSELISLFVTPVVKSNIGRKFTKDELQVFNTGIPMFRDTLMHQTKGEVVSIDSPKNQSESYNIFDDFVEELKDIKTFCEQELKRYLEEIEGVDTDITNLSITASWLNKIKPQECTHPHSHGNSHLTGILYISCVPNDSIQFINMNCHPRSFGRLELPKKETTTFTADTASVNVKEGDLILFPSWVPHQVGVNKTENKERISLSFDTFPTYLPSLYPPFK